MAGDFIKLPGNVGSIIDFVTEEDRRYFEDHPQARSYDRAPHPLELWPGDIPAKGWIIRVFQIEPGARLRVPYPEGGKPDKAALKLVRSARKACRQAKHL